MRIVRMSIFFVVLLVTVIVFSGCYTLAMPGPYPASCYQQQPTMVAPQQTVIMPQQTVIVQQPPVNVYVPYGYYGYARPPSVYYHSRPSCRR